MKRWAIAAPVLLVTVLLTTLLTSWYTLPHWLPQAVNAMVSPYHYQLNHWAFSRPSLSGWEIQSVNLYKIPVTKRNYRGSRENPVLVAKIENISIDYSLESIIRKQVTQIKVGRIEWHRSRTPRPAKSIPATLSTTQLHHYLKNFEHLKGVPSLSVDHIKIVDIANKHPDIGTPTTQNSTVPLLLNHASLTMSASKNAVNISLMSKIKALDFNIKATLGNEYVISTTIKDQHGVTSTATIKLHSSAERLDSAGSFAVDLSHINDLPGVAGLAFVKQFQHQGNSLKGVWSGGWQGHFSQALELPKLTLTSEQDLNVELSLNHNILTTRQSLQVELSNQQLKTTVSPSQAYLEGSPAIKKKLTEWLKLPASRASDPPMVLTINQPIVASTPITDAMNMNFESSIVSDINFTFSNGLKEEMLFDGTGSVSLTQLKPLKAELSLAGHMGSFHQPWPKQSEISLSAEVSNKNDAWILSLLQPLQLSWEDWAVKDGTEEEKVLINLPQGDLKLTINDEILFGAPLKASGRLTFNAEPVIATAQLPALKLVSPWNVAGGVIEFTDWHVQWDKLVADGYMKVNPSSQTGTLKWQAYLPNAHEWLTQYSPSLPEPLTVKDGSLATTGQLIALAGGKFNAVIHSNASSWSGTWNELVFEGLSVSSDINITEDMTATGTNAVGSLDYFDPGFPIEEIKSQFTWTISDFDIEQLQLNITDLSANLLSGTVFNTAPFIIQPSNINTSVDLSVSGIALKDLLALEKQAVRGEGTIDGSIPLELHHSDVVVNNGYLRARPPGGWIKFEQSGSFKSMARNNENLLLAFSALEDFHYQTLESSVDYQSNGDLLFAVSLSGKNPGFKQGQAFDFNINIENNLKALFKSLQLSEDINKRISERYQ